MELPNTAEKRLRWLVVLLALLVIFGKNAWKELILEGLLA